MGQINEFLILNIIIEDSIGSDSKETGKKGTTASKHDTVPNYIIKAFKQLSS